MLKVKLTDGHAIDLRFRVFDDGIGFRYELPKLKEDRTILGEATTFNINPKGMHGCKTSIGGRRHTSISTKTKFTSASSPRNIEKMVGPFLRFFEIDNNWMLITETNNSGATLGSHIRNEKDNPEYHIVHSRLERKNKDEQLLQVASKRLAISMAHHYFRKSSASNGVQSNLSFGR